MRNSWFGYNNITDYTPQVLKASESSLETKCKSIALFLTFVKVTFVYYPTKSRQNTTFLVRVWK